MAGRECVADLEWMWADAGLVRGIAVLNPFRWKRGEPLSVAESLEASCGSESDATRPVSLRVAGSAYHQVFDSPAGAAKWIRRQLDDGVPKGPAQQSNGTASELAQPGEVACISHLMASHLVRGTAPAALAVFCRANVDASAVPYLQRNLFQASVYSESVCGWPKRVSKRQQELTSEVSLWHPRVYGSWDDFHGQPASSLLPFIEAASLAEGDRPSDIACEGAVFQRLLESFLPAAASVPDISDKVTWARTDSGFASPFWAVYDALLGDVSYYVVAFRGGNGNVDDAKCHPGSPALAFINGTPRELAPDLPTEFLSQVLSGGADAGCRKQGERRLIVLGFSMGSLPALATAVSFVHPEPAQDHLLGCVLFNAATAMWPLWLSKRLGDERGVLANEQSDVVEPASWWKDERIGQFWAPRIQHWCIKNDPLSEGYPGGVARTPQTPGRTVVLPTVSDTRLMDNHSLSNFYSRAAVSAKLDRRTGQ